MRRLLRDRSTNAAVAWAGVLVVVVTTAWSVAAGEVPWALLGAGAATLYRRPRSADSR